jgi:hypothetical protein
MNYFNVTFQIIRFETIRYTTITKTVSVIAHNPKGSSQNTDVSQAGLTT